MGFLATLEAEDDEARTLCDACADELSRRREAEQVEVWNLELPFKLKQGQLEVEEAPVVTDYSEAVLVHRDVVSSLNTDIKKLGAERVRDLQLLRVTKDLQGKMKGDTGEKQQVEVLQ